MKLSRRIVLRGIGGATLALPLLESLVPRGARAQSASTPAFAVFFRQANGVAQGGSGSEADRFWPTATGTLTAATMQGRAVEELSAVRAKLLVLKNVTMNGFSYGDGHAQGALQGLTARGPTVADQGGDSEAAGESIDHRIGRELNPAGRDSLFMYAGAGGGWLGGPCISYRSAGQRRSALLNPWTAYQQLTSTSGGSVAQLIAQGQRSVNDLVRGQLSTVLQHPRLSSGDRDRLELHLQSVRDVETALSCQLTPGDASAVQSEASGYASSDGNLVLTAARAHMRVIALAIACGYTRSAALQIGSGNDTTRYHRLDDGALMENYHYISHRLTSHDSSGAPIPNADLLHHMVDRQFAQTFKFLIDQLSAYPTPDGKTLLDQGVCCWYNDNANGPPHAIRPVPWILAGSCNGYLKQGQHLTVQSGQSAPNHHRLLNTILTAVGVRKAGGAVVDDFGDPSLTKGLLPELAA